MFFVVLCDSLSFPNSFRLHTVNRRNALAPDYAQKLVAFANQHQTPGVDGPIGRYDPDRGIVLVTVADLDLATRQLKIYDVPVSSFRELRAALGY